MEKTKEMIIERLRATRREHIEDVIAYMEKKGFFTVRCHSHHCYRGGMADHAWQVYQIAKKLEEKECKVNPRHRALDDDSLAICCILHDFCDCYGYKGVGGHGFRSAKMLHELGLDLSRDEFLAIRYHMSLHNHIHDALYPEANRCQLRYRVHTADGRSARGGGGPTPALPRREGEESLKV